MVDNLLGDVHAKELSRMNVVFNIEDKYSFVHVEISIPGLGGRPMLSTFPIKSSSKCSA
jgi:hypothetical protein